MPAATIYLSGHEVTGERASEPELASRLAKLSAADCLLWIAHLQTSLFKESSPAEGPDLQRRLVSDVLGDTQIGTATAHRLAEMPSRIVFHEQQLVHLARLVLRHCDRRPRDQFADGALAEHWGRCLLGVNDLLDVHLDTSDERQMLSWEIRQCYLNQHEDQLPVCAINHELYGVLWPARSDAISEEVNAAFFRKTKMTITDYFTVGAATIARLAAQRGRDANMPPGIEPGPFFAQSEIPEPVWRAFFKRAARDLTALADELAGEERQFGATTYGSLTFERYPLAEIEPGLFVPVSMRSLQRRVFHGIFHILRDAAASDRHDRFRYTTKLGPVFQESVENTLRRGVSFSPDRPQIVRDITYGPRRKRRRSTDVILAYERNPVFVEVTSGAPNAATVTRGDLASFADDMTHRVVKKARQLDTNIRAFLSGELQLPGAPPSIVAHAWPVILTLHTFPCRERIAAAVESQLRQKGYLQDPRIGALAIVSAEELFFCEGFMEQGRTFLALIRGWKSGPHRDLPFKNYLIEEGGGRAPSSRHFHDRFDQFHDAAINRLAG